jgi:short subunit fatty acids transporter
VTVAPPEVFPSLGGFLSREFAILAMLLPQVDTVSPIFLPVPRVIVAALAIIVPLVMVIVSPHRRWEKHQGSSENRAQNQETTHIVNLAPHKGTSPAFRFEWRESLRARPKLVT